MPKALKGDWVEISAIVLEPAERAAGLPCDTASVPYTLQVRGHTVEQGEIGKTITIRTLSGRLLKGELTEINPAYSHNFGECVPELLQTRIRLKELRDEVLK